MVKGDFWEQLIPNDKHVDKLKFLAFPKKMKFGCCLKY